MKPKSITLEANMHISFCNSLTNPFGYNLATKNLKNPDIEVNNGIIAAKYELKVRILI